MPLYFVKFGDEERLIEAPSGPSARSFAMASRVECHVASKEECFRVAKAGGEIEVAKEAPELPPEATAASEPPEQDTAEAKPGKTKTKELESD